MENISIKTRFVVEEEQLLFLKLKDPRLAELIDFVGEIENYYISDPFTALLNGIVYQAISFKAANSIWNRFVSNIGEMTPENIIETDIEVLRQCGLSQTKVQYIRNIAIAFLNADFEASFPIMSNDEIRQSLIKIKGIGNWTVEMFLIFCLCRLDVISFGDLAIRRGLEWLYDLDHPITAEEFHYFSNKFSPYGTIASLYLWEITIRGYLEFASLEKLINNK